jgi:hypothetical protein
MPNVACKMDELLAEADLERWRPTALLYAQISAEVVGAAAGDEEFDG